MTRLLDRYRRVLAHLLPRAMVWLTALVSLSLLWLGLLTAGALVAVLVVAFLTAWRVSRPAGDRHLAARGALGVGLAAAINDHPAPTLLAALLVLGALMAEPSIGRATLPGLSARNLPGYVRPLGARVHEPVFLGVAAGLFTLALGVLGLPSFAVFALVLLELLAAAALAGYQLVRARRHSDEREIRAALTAYAPSYGLYYSGTSHGSYQVTMWLPYLRRTGRAGVLVIRDPRFLRDAGRLFDLPVVLARSVEPLEYAVVPSLNALFYVNNDVLNAHAVRFADVTHVHLGHGDSDKPASYAATTAMFDRIFVAGTAGVDRFTQHGVLVPREKFVLVGRPQLEQVEVRRPDAVHGERPVVLYAPTWRGGLEDSVLGSLRFGERIITALLAAGATVWFRPHPYSVRDAESRVLIGRIDALLAADRSHRHLDSNATARRTIFECFNASDALVTDISSVASDYLYSNKPFAMTDTGAVDDLEAAFPVVRAAVVLPVGGDVATPLAALLDDDPRRQERESVRRFYLGDWPPEEYPGVFVAAALAAMAARPSREPSPAS